mgnify:CR=1 FL=1
MDGELSPGAVASLSVHAAALEAPDRLALVSGPRLLPFAELAELALATARRGGVVPSGDGTPGVARRGAAEPARGEAADGDAVWHFRAQSELETVVQVLAALEARRTFLPLHPKLTSREADALIKLAAGYRGAPAALIATSGTSGAPKLAVLDHHALLAAALASNAHLGFQADDRWLLCIPLAHVGGLSIVTRCLVARKPIVVLPSFDPDAVFHAIETKRATLLSVVPTMLSTLMRHPRSAALTQLRVILVGGAAFDPALRQEARARKLRVLATYGCTEMASQITTQRPSDAQDPRSAGGGVADSGVPLGGPDSGVPLGGSDSGVPQGVDSGVPLGGSDSGVPLGGADSGVPLGGVEVRIGGSDEDDDATHRATRRQSDPPRGGYKSRAGPILVRGPMRMRGYVGEAELAPNAWFDTGDLGSTDDSGRLYVLGRSDDVIVTGGENVQPLEVENALRQATGVRDALVCGVPDAEWGQRVGALLVLESGVDAEAVLGAAAHELAGFKLPRVYCIVGELPRTRLGKPDRTSASRALQNSSKP